MRKVLVSVAPIAATDKQIDPVAVANDVIACYKLGAAMVHLHVRDNKGNLTTDITCLEEIVRRIKQETDMIIQISTGGVSDLTIEERCIPLELKWAEATSLNVGSVNLGQYVYQNPIKEVEYCVEQTIARHKIPEIEVFELGMIYTVKELSQKYNFIKPILFSIVLGHEGAAPATPQTLESMLLALKEFFPDQEQIRWGLTHANRRDFEMMKFALDQGAQTLRIGFEDSNFVSPERTAEKNESIVKEVGVLLKEKDLEFMTSSEARAMLAISNYTV